MLRWVLSEHMQTVTFPALRRGAETTIQHVHTFLLTSAAVHVVTGWSSFLELLHLLGHGHISARFFHLPLVTCRQVEGFGHRGTFPGLYLKTE